MLSLPSSNLFWGGVMVRVASLCTPGIPLSWGFGRSPVLVTLVGTGILKTTNFFWLVPVFYPSNGTSGFALRFRFIGNLVLLSLVAGI